MQQQRVCNDDVGCRFWLLWRRRQQQGERRRQAFVSDVLFVEAAAMVEGNSGGSG
jgi:hypothetical protein